MKIDFQLGDTPRNGTVTTVGSFDGVHLGHQHIVAQMHLEANLRGLSTLVASFHPHPREVLSGECTQLLTPVLERTQCLSALKVQHHALVPFDEALSSMEPEEFVQVVLVDVFKIKMIIVGYDHRFGKGRRGDIHLLRKMGSNLGFDVLECKEVAVDGVTVSSSKIRSFAQNGQVAEARQMLGRHYALTGNVIHGSGRGRGIGIPTANIEVHPAEKLIPSSGVYAVRVEIVDAGTRLGGMMNIGSRPTFEGSEDVTIEVHLFDYDGDLYDREVRVEFVERIRDERKFDSVSHLIEQLNRDRVRCIGLLRAVS